MFGEWANRKVSFRGVKKLSINNSEINAANLICPASGHWSPKLNPFAA
jgi:hypothetical protein